MINDIIITRNIDNVTNVNFYPLTISRSSIKIKSVLLMSVLEKSLPIIPEIIWYSKLSSPVLWVSK